MRVDWLSIIYLKNKTNIIIIVIVGETNEEETRENKI